MDNVDEIIRMLDQLTENEVSRIKIEASEKEAQGDVKRTYHHGRCDVGSPFAEGKLFDLEDPGC